jgi:hypothetical protein
MTTASRQPADAYCSHTARTHARAHTQTHTNMQYILLFYSNNIFVNEPQCYVIRTLPLFFINNGVLLVLLRECQCNKEHPVLWSLTLLLDNTLCFIPRNHFLTTQSQHTNYTLRQNPVLRSYFSRTPFTCPTAVVEEYCFTTTNSLTNHNRCTPLDEGSARRRVLCLTTRNAHKTDISMPVQVFNPQSQQASDHRHSP